MENDNILNTIFSMLVHRVIVPSDFHSQVTEIKTMLKDDVSGVVDSLTDFAVNAASVDYKIVSDNDNFNTTLQNWLETINISYNGQIPVGIKNLAKEYFKERWKGASFPVLKMKWAIIDGIKLPTQMFFVDGGSVYAQGKTTGDNLSLLGYDYYIGKTTDHEYLLSGDNVVISRPYGRWFDEYPTPYLIKRGIFHNWKIIQSLKKKEIEILEQIIPYMLLIKKGSEALATQHIKTYNDTELQAVKDKFQHLLNDIKSNQIDDRTIKTPIRATNFDEDINHFIPEIGRMFDVNLFAVAERNILAGLGMIDIADAVSTSRRESILNPKAFIEEIKTGVDDFKQILNYLVLKIIEKNTSKPKYIGSTFDVTSSPVRGFMSDTFKQLIRSLYDRGQVSKQTTVELIGEIDFETEVMRRDKETNDGLDEKMYPPVINNQEDKGLDLPGNQPDTTVTTTNQTDKNGNPIPLDKQGIDKKNYTNANTLEGAPYNTVEDLPPTVKDNMTPSLQRTFIKIWNNAFHTYNDDIKASKVAWAIIAKIAHKGKNGKWVKNTARVKLTKSMIEEAIDELEPEIMDEASDKMVKDTLEQKNLHIATLKEELLNKLLHPKQEE